ncbi:MAG: hypothetical protein Ct9H300mP26_2080 [Acidimicrobiales bacterium]|nr:MAG: hypothetical protein Ct9H300mP26_2080 [Acidimicrobiales bacterium]
MKPQQKQLLYAGLAVMLSSFGSFTQQMARKLQPCLLGRCALRRFSPLALCAE